MIISIKKSDVGYNNMSYSYKDDFVRIDFTFGLLEIVINNKVIYSHVLKIKGLKEQELKELINPIIIETLIKNGVYVERVIIK